jgi:hypothetical protein
MQARRPPDAGGRGFPEAPSRELDLILLQNRGMVMITLALALNGRGP